MIPGSFDYFRPSSMAEVFALQSEHGFDAQLLAGGHTLLPMMKLRLATPAVLIDLGGVAALRAIVAEPGGVRVGAMVTHANVGAHQRLGGSRSVISDASEVIGDPMVRNRGTLGGSLACADAASDWPAVMLSLDAELRIASQRGTRAVALASFYDGFMSTVLKPGEVLESIFIPTAPTGESSAYLKLKHPGSGLAVVGVAAVLQLSGPTIMDARVAITGACENPIRLTEVEKHLIGKPADTSTIKHASPLAKNLSAPMNDRFASADYRCHLASVYTRRALESALSRVVRH